MAYEGAEQTITITVLALSVSFSAPSKMYVGDKVTFTGKLTADGQAVAGETVAIEAEVPPGSGDYLEIGEVASGSDGTFSMAWTVSDSIAGIRVVGQQVKFRARHVPSGATSTPKTALIVYRSRISGLAAEPTVIFVGQSVLISGYLEYMGADGTWHPIVGGEVNVYVNGSLYTTTWSDETGRFAASVRFTSPGTYTVRIVFTGKTGLAYTPLGGVLYETAFEPAEATISVEVGGELAPEEEVPEEGVPGGLLALGIAGATVLGLYALKRLRERGYLARP